MASAPPSSLCSNLFDNSPTLLCLNADIFSMLQNSQASMEDHACDYSQFHQLLAQEALRRQHVESELHQERELAHAALAAIADAVITTDISGRIHYFNPIAESLLGHKLAQVQGLSIGSVLRLQSAQTQLPIDCPIEQMLQTQQTIQVIDQAILVGPNNQEYAIDFSVAPMQDSQGKLIGAVLVFRDVTIARGLAQQLAWQASHDALTSLVNRREFEDRLSAAISGTQTDDDTHVLCYLDLDQFKIVNDTCGHIAGDHLLLALTAILAKEIRGTDLLARLGGDEFGILFHQVSLVQAHTIVSRIQQRLHDFRFVWQNESFNVTASFGLVAIEAASTNLTEVMSAADAACYAAKEAGRNRIHLYYSDDDELTRQRGERLWIARINQAIEENRFVLYGQEIAPIQLGESVYKRHMEILLRMVDRDGSLIAPGCFIPAAERYGLMTEIDRVVITTFFQSYRSAKAVTGMLDDCMYAINLSAISLNDEKFIDFVKSQLLEHSVPPEVICFEITETAAISNLTKASQLIQELKQMGCRFALDDFGSGMNCFAYLKLLPIDYLKIDGTFIKNIINEPIDQELVACMNRIAHVVGAKTVAEWVEDEATLKILRAIGIDYGQGFGISRPEPLVFTPRQTSTL
jgi:diguanylate cyclase (GGDEF)-like protein/PAS domain S-box-containing protein